MVVGWWRGEGGRWVFWGREGWMGSVEGQDTKGLWKGEGRCVRDDIVRRDLSMLDILILERRGLMEGGVASSLSVLSR